MLDEVPGIEHVRDEEGGVTGEIAKGNMRIAGLLQLVLQRYNLTCTSGQAVIEQWIADPQNILTMNRILHVRSTHMGTCTYKHTHTHAHMHHTKHTRTHAPHKTHTHTCTTQKHTHTYTHINTEAIHTQLYRT